MFNPLLSRISEISEKVHTILKLAIEAMSPTSDGGEILTEKEIEFIIMYINSSIYSLNDLKLSLERGSVVAHYNMTISSIVDCKVCDKIDKAVLISDIAKNPNFTQALFEIKHILELIDDKIAEGCEHGIKHCIIGIADQLYNFEELTEVADALIEVAYTFSDITMVSDMMFDFEKFYKTVFILRHEDINVGIALGSIKSVLPYSEDSEIEFF